MQHSFQTHPRFQSHHEEHQVEPSKIHQQILNPYACYSAKCHWQDTERPISAHVESNEIVCPKFQQLVLPYSYGKYTNVTKLNKLRIATEKHTTKIRGVDGKYLSNEAGIHTLMQNINFKSLF